MFHIVCLHTKLDFVKHGVLKVIQLSMLKCVQILMLFSGWAGLKGWDATHWKTGVQQHGRTDGL